MKIKLSGLLEDSGVGFGVLWWKVIGVEKLEEK